MPKEIDSRIFIHSLILFPFQQIFIKDHYDPGTILVLLEVSSEEEKNGSSISSSEVTGYITIGDMLPRRVWTALTKWKGIFSGALSG